MCGVEGEYFATRFGNPAQFVVFKPGRARPLVGAVGQVAGAVVAVAAFDGLRDRVRNGWRVYPVCGRFRGAADHVRCRR